MINLLLQWIPIAAAGVCLSANAQESPATQPIDNQTANVEDLSDRVGAKPSLGGLPTLPEEGYWIDTAPINEVFQYLARSAGLQYFFNNELSAPQYNVTGHLKTDNPRQQMEELATAFGLTIFQQQSTLSLMTEQQLAKLPVEVMSYELKYLRGAPLNRNVKAAAGGEGGAASLADFEKLKAIIKPMLTREVGQIEFEEKTNTLLVSDNKIKLERVHKLLAELDKAKKQILINVRVLRVNRGSGRNTGIDWSKALGETGTNVTVSQSLNALFNLPNSNKISVTGAGNALTRNITKDIDGGAGLVFGNIQMTAILHALISGDFVSQEACPTIITEDNEQGIISIVDRFPVITSDTSATSAGQSVTEKVRYAIDEKDPSPTDEPEKSREIGVTLSVTPTLLPDGTVRMKLRPRVAKIVELVAGQTGNVYPRVSESTVEAISRIPNGESLFLGGFYDYNNTNSKNRVPVLGTMPFLKKLFSNDQKKLEQVSLVFIITPRVYDASEPSVLPMINHDVREYSGMQPADVGEASPLLPAVVSEKSVEAVTAPTGSWLKRLFTKPQKSSSQEEAAPSSGLPRSTSFPRR